MNKNNQILRKYVAILALVFLPNVLFAQGAVVEYLWGENPVLEPQLSRLTHVMAVDLYPDANGFLFSQNLCGGCNHVPTTPETVSSGISLKFKMLDILINSIYQKNEKIFSY